MKQEKLALSGAMLASIFASLCCLGPLLFVALGLGAFGVGAVLEPLRPYLLIVAVLALAFGFYRTYFQRESCAPGEACTTKPIDRTSRAALWVVSLAVLAFALSPYYAGALANRMTPALTEAALNAKTIKATFKVTGMTCAGCETCVKLALQKVKGVKSAKVSYERKEAVVLYDPRETTTEKLQEAINEAGYSCKLKR